MAREGLNVILIHNILGGSISTNTDSSNIWHRFIYTLVVALSSFTLFVLSMLDLRDILYSRDLVLSVIDLLMLFGIASNVVTVQTSSLIKCLYTPKASIAQCLSDIDGHLYALDMHLDPFQAFSLHCALAFGSTTAITVAYLLVNVLQPGKANVLMIAFKSYGLFVTFLTHGLFLVFSYQIFTRVRCMVMQLEKMIRAVDRRDRSVAVLQTTTDRFSRVLKTLSYIQAQCFRAASNLNDEFGLPNVAVFGLFFYVLTAKSFQLFYICSIQLRRDGLNVIDALEPAVLVLAAFTYFSAATYLGERILREIQLVVNNLHKFECMQSHQIERTQTELVERLGHQIIHQPISFTVINFFQIDLKFFHLVMASIATYLIILLQFDFQS